jgi:hypothetical protein
LIALDYWANNVTREDITKDVVGYFRRFERLTGIRFLAVNTADELVYESKGLGDPEKPPDTGESLEGPSRANADD